MKSTRTPRITVERVFPVILGLLLSACTQNLLIEPTVSLDPGPAVIGAEQADRHWWQLRIRLTWPQGEQPDFSRHLLIAEQLFLPAIVEHQAELPLWRFHRRAGRSDSGHQFSLIFFSNTETAARISEEIESSPLSQWLMENDMIDKIRFDQRSSQELGRLEQTSDPGWPIEIQRSWPYFIMGASQAWLLLVQELSAENALAGEIDYPSLLLHYQQVNASLNSLWRDNGQHAYLHHLSAVFGYQPLVIRSTELKSF